MFGLFKKSPKPSTDFQIPVAFAGKAKMERTENGAPILQLPCGADLWCRKRTSVTTMLDPSLFEIYTTGDDRIDQEWIVQTNPPSAFKAEFKAGCDALFALLQEDSSLHAHKGWLIFKPAKAFEADSAERYFGFMQTVVQTAERELIKHD
jgi:hypothetical protein